MGRGLFEWIYHHYSSGGSAGVLGYDPIQGAFSPPLRLRMHLGSICLLWSFFLFFWPSYLFKSSNDDDVCYAFQLSRYFYAAGQCALLLYLGVFWVLFYVMPGVSTPGGPREFKIERQPQWDDLEHKHDLIDRFSFVTGSSSHEDSTKRFAGTACAITGEPAGRDIWSDSSDNKSKYSRVDEKLVQELASGGRDRTSFNPSNNPNSCDIPFRAQMIRRYLGKGGKAPAKDAPKSTREAIQKAAHFYSMLQTEDGHWSGDYGGEYKPLFRLSSIASCTFSHKHDF